MYLLGAGFSAPLGLPVMANFVSRSKDQFAASPKRFEDFGSVFGLFDKLAKVKSFYRSDLSNIEEILSILTIGEFSATPGEKSRFVKYLGDVIEYFTPSLTTYPGTLPSNWRTFAFGNERSHNDYGNFVMALARRSLTYSGTSAAFSTSPPEASVPTYALVSLNYDGVIEVLHDYCKRFLALAVPLALNKLWTSDDYHINLCKLHGSAHDRSIVPPTWSKGSDRLPAAAWAATLQEIGRANHLRILGYSLPDSDLNVRYLLKAAALESFHLKTVDVVCLDPNKTVKARYDAFIDHFGYRFKSGDLANYFSNITARASETPGGNVGTLLEQTHAAFMREPAA